MARNNIHQFVARKKAEKLEQLLPYDLGDLLIGELERELPKLLPDCEREVIERLEETY
jgi:hypothetical protein